MPHLKAIFLILFLLLARLYSHAQRPADITMILASIHNNKADTSTVNSLLGLANVLIEKPGRERRDLDSLKTVLGYVRIINTRLAYLRGEGCEMLLQAKAEREWGTREEARRFGNQALTLLKLHGTNHDLGEAYIELGGSYDNEDAVMEEKIRLYQQGAALLHEAGDLKEEARIREFIGDLFQVHGEYDKAMASLEQALKLYDKIGWKRVHGVYDLMGVVCFQTGKSSQALKYGLMAIQIAEQLHDSSMLIAAIYHRVATTYVGSDFVNEAIRYYQKALVVARSHKDNSFTGNILFNMAGALQRIGRNREALDTLTAAIRLRPMRSPDDRVDVDIFFLSIYISLVNFHEAEPYFNELTRLYTEKALDELNRQRALAWLIYYLQQAGRYQESYPYLEDFAKDDQGVEGPLQFQKLQSLEKLYFIADSATGRFVSAVRHLQRQKLFSDSIVRQVNAKELNLLQVEFETQRKDRDIELLTQKELLSGKTLQSSVLVRNLVIAGIVVLLLLSAMGVTRYRDKQRSNNQLQEQQVRINSSNRLLQKLLDEKEWLLKEIHHRVKNNLQVVISLLNSQSSFLENKDAVSAIQESQHRMQAMALIHQKLYQSDNLTSVRMPWYIGELLDYIRESLDNHHNIGMEVDIDPVELDVAQAVPLGLIINEAVTNSFKYAFPAGRSGKVGVTLKAFVSALELTIRDNGIGLPGGFDPVHTDSLGMSLMMGLTEQLEGRLNIMSNNGTIISIVFERQFTLQTKHGRQYL